ncbi:TetR/AcrR family transcriptional regulator [Croceicoccus ponticola]|nr:TetR/AcrR family transcriptional regulator [Croceicoccus ponticola]
MIAQVIEEMALTTGVEEIRMREVAERVGCSTNAIYHYFRSKAEMLIHAQKLGRRRAGERLAALAETVPFAERIDVLLPLSEDRRREWHTWFLLWGMPQTDPAVAAERREGADDANRLVSELVRGEIEAGRLDKSSNAEDVAYDIMLIVNGIASLAAPDPVSWPTERQQATLRRHLKGLGFHL